MTGMTPPEMRRLKQLEDENAKPKRIVADLSLEKGRKLHLPAVQRMGPDQPRPGSNRSWMTTQWQVSAQFVREWLSSDVISGEYPLRH